MVSLSEELLVEYRIPLVETVKEMRFPIARG
jgi:hypothetical protein